jgi:hypothetical protein
MDHRGLGFSFGLRVPYCVQDIRLDGIRTGARGGKMIREGLIYLCVGKQRLKKRFSFAYQSNPVIQLITAIKANNPQII